MPTSVATNANLPRVIETTSAATPLLTSPSGPLFSIGIFQDPSITGPYQISTSSAAYAWVYYQIRDPQEVSLRGPDLLGQGSTGFPITRGYSSMTWNYGTLRSTQWYWFYWLWRQARLGGGLIQISWPDPGSGAVQTATGRWAAITSATRDVAAVHDVTLLFNHLGIDDSVAPPGIWVATA